MIQDAYEILKDHTDEFGTCRCPACVEARLEITKNLARELATYTEHRSWCEIRTRPRVNGATWKCTCGLREVIEKLEEK